MTLRVYDSLSRQEHDFEPLEPGHVRLYVCGMTVQDRPHIGHFLPFLTAETVRRWLEYRGYRVTHVQNFTDIDDKIIDRANQEGVSARVVAERNIEQLYDILDRMHMLRATHYPKATEHIPEIIALIARLIERGYAYAAENGDVYFRVRRLPDYGKLSGRKVDDLMSGARIEVGEQKDDPLDFALWKAAKPGEPQWDSPWGPGRPGWHIECSAMSMKYLGETLDMHGGGRDLLFPHHENELAQSEAATGKPFVRFWMHNGLLTTGGQKMSKSLGNFFLMEDLLQEFSADELRFFLLSTHFRSQAEYSEERLREAQAAFGRIREGAVRLQEGMQQAGEPTPIRSAAGQELLDEAKRLRQEFCDAMDHDFNSAAALGKAFELVRASNRFVGQVRSGEDRSVLDEVHEILEWMMQVLGFFAEGLPSTASASEAPAEIEALARQRLEARAARNFQESDALRDQIAALGWVVEDRPDGYRLKRR
jgi:cysteinyl-tRNA synthetase